ncbi:MAG: hypothetical protein ABJM06_12820 [Gilvibacter sp.]
MKSYKQPLRNTLFVLILFFTNTVLIGQVLTEDSKNLNKPETEKPTEIYWNVKAYNPSWGLLKVKALDKEGNIYDIKAIQDSEDTSILNVKALVKGERVAVKIIVKDEDQYYPVKAITSDGTILDVKAIDEDGEIIDIKGISKTGNIVHIRAVRPQTVLYNIVAVAPNGKVNDVKGIKMMSEDLETVLYGVKVFAHIKAITQN